MHCRPERCYARARESRCVGRSCAAVSGMDTAFSLRVLRIGQLVWCSHPDEVCCFGGSTQGIRLNQAQKNTAP